MMREDSKLDGEVNILVKNGVSKTLYIETHLKMG